MALRFDSFGSFGAKGDRENFRQAVSVTAGCQRALSVTDTLKSNAVTSLSTPPAWTSSPPASLT
jgi:hypothetical protein